MMACPSPSLARALTELLALLVHGEKTPTPMLGSWDSLSVELWHEHGGGEWDLRAHVWCFATVRSALQGLEEKERGEKRRRRVAGLDPLLRSSVRRPWPGVFEAK